MPQHIVKLEGKYMIWSTIVDAPVYFGMSLETLRKLWRAEYGRVGLPDLERRLQRVEATGTDSPVYASPGALIAGNRAGPGESELSFDEVVEFYVRQLRQPEPSPLKRYRQRKAAG